MKYEVVRGTKDILPQDIRYWHEVERVCRDIFNAYAFEEIRTPIFEKTELFTRSIGDNTDIVEKEMYTFQDKGDRSLTLRPEGTAPIVRAYIQHNLHQYKHPSKLYYIGPMFRYERPQAGRFRQFHQVGVENIGSSSPLSDAEAISLGIHLFDALGIPDLSVSINSVGCGVCRPVIEERIKQFLGSSLKSMCSDCQRRFVKQPMRLLDCKKEKCRAYLSGLPEVRSSHCQECRDHFELVLEYLDVLGVEFEIDPRLVRGLDYYTRTTFEIISTRLGAQNAICGGGRYDTLVSQLGGKPTPAVGFAFGIERAVMLLKDLVNYQQAGVKLYMIPIGQAQRSKCFKLLNALRRKGIKCEIGETDSFKAQFKKALSLDSEYTLMYGEEEAEKKEAVLKNMKTRKQKSYPFRSLKKILLEELA